MVLRQHRKPTAAEWSQITSRRPVVRKIPKELLHLPKASPDSLGSTDSPKAMKKGKGE
jgi:hypothetical protein